jgi:trk system potassium uptake protein TrkH
MHMKASRLRLSTTHIILLSFLLAILVGTGLLWLPISTRSGESVAFLDALFTATTSTCVTGLVTVTTATTWSTFGQIVILLLIQVGGLGVITVMAGFMMALHRRMGLSDRLLLQDAFNLNTLSGLAAFIRRVIIGTLIVEGVGALCCMTVFVPDFGARGIWISVFHAISAFCNAGIDIFATDSLCSYATDPIINTVTSLLIILGGLGYVVWWDVIRVFGDRQIKGGRLRHLTLHSKIALASTAVLLLGGGLLIFLFEYDNPLTIGGMSLFDKIQVSLFQSVTTRTAGFASVPQQNLTEGSSVVSLLLMFIGGSPVGTAGGIKTVTITVLAASAMATVQNKTDVTLFRRRLSDGAIRRAVAVASISFAILSLSTLLLCATTDASLPDVLFETVSATATVGLSRDLTSTLPAIAKVIIIATMYLGRVGPISLAFAFSVKKQTPNIVKDPTEEISVG